MAGMSAQALRSLARQAMLEADGRGFMRFLPIGGDLLVCDALRRCPDEGAAERLKLALTAAGFTLKEEDGLLLLTPAEGLLRREDSGAFEVCWTGKAAQQEALAARFLREEPLPLTEAGKQLIVETIRLTWQDTAHVRAGLDGLRARAAEMLRTGDRSGLHEAGAWLAAWCRTQRGESV